MKPKVKDYAKALAELIIEGKKNVAVSFLTLLKKNGDIKKANNIIALAQALVLKKSGNKRIIVQTARKSKNISIHIAKKGDVIEEEIRPEIIAGVKIIIDGERQLDFSLKNKLDKMF